MATLPSPEAWSELDHKFFMSFAVCREIDQQFFLLMILGLILTVFCVRVVTWKWGMSGQTPRLGSADNRIFYGSGTSSWLLYLHLKLKVSLTTSFYLLQF